MSYTLKVFAGIIFSLFINSVAQSQVTITNPELLGTFIIKKEGVTDPSAIGVLTAAERTKVVNYVDGFGRSIQQVVVGGSVHGKDIVSFTKYNALGQVPVQYLPFESSGTSGNYIPMSQVVTDQSTFYSANTYSGKVAQDPNPYSENMMELSPLQRVVIAGGVGSGFGILDQATLLNYGTNLASENIRKWLPDGTGFTVYGNSELVVSSATDGANITSKIYKDKSGKTILKREDAGGTAHDTYYIYDNLGNLICVVPPKALEVMGSTSFNITNTEDLVFKFWYDHKNRVVRKKVPGAKEVYMVYDPLDRLVLMQDGNLRAVSDKIWSYMKYDNAGRVISQGIYTHDAVFTQVTLEYMQDYVNIQACYDPGSIIYFEQKLSGTTGYTNQCFPTSGIEDRQYNYYDTYDFNADGTADYSHIPQGLTGESVATGYTHGMLTGTRKRILGSSTWLTEMSFYNRYNHVIQVRSNNQLVSAVNDQTTNVVSFTGKVLESKRSTALPTWTAVVKNRYLYDVMERLTEVKQTNGSYGEMTVARYQYNALGQLIDKKLHSSNGTDFLQSVDLRYNIRGQLTSINNSARTYHAQNNDDVGQNEDLFGMELFYDKQTDIGGASNGISNTPDYRGMISGIKWSAKTTGTPDEKSFVYTYDALNRLTAAAYKGKAWGTLYFTKEVGGFNESFSYDRNGNITGLQRSAVLGGTITAIDNLTYTYKTAERNQLDYISETVAPITAGYGYRNFTGVSSSTAYTYDHNGNLKTDPKKGTTITYNELNKPTEIRITATKRVVYRYDASGIRISKHIYNDGVPLKEVEYIKGYVIEDGNLSYFAMAEGRVRNAGTASLIPTMEYFITDHQGNVRISFEDNGSNINIPILKQENSYYAFGMQMAGAYLPASPNPNLYNAGSEWQNDITNLADYYSTFFREYDPVIGRFSGVDPMAQVTFAITTYAYANNNPILLNDPLGNYAQNKYESIKYYKPERGTEYWLDWQDRMMGMENLEEYASGGGGSDYENLKADLEYFRSEDWNDAYDAANISKFVYGDADAILTGGWQVSFLNVGQIDNDAWSGFKGQLFEKIEYGKVTRYMYAFAGTENGVDGLHDALQLMGKSKQYDIAVDNARILSRRLDKPLSFTGHSLGGGLASIAALVTGRSAITFNAAGLSSATEKRYYTRDRDGNNITAFIVKREILHKYQSNGFYQLFFGLFEARGKKIFIPDVDTSIKNHTIDSVIKSLKMY